MHKAATLKGYLKDISQQALTTLGKAKLKEDIKAEMLYFFPIIITSATDEAIKYFEKFCDGTYNLGTARGIIECVHEASVLLQHCENFDVADSEAVKGCKRAESLEAKLKADYEGSIKKKQTSPHSLSSMQHFRQSMESPY